MHISIFSAENDDIFRNCCKSGHLEIVKFISEIDDKIKIHAVNELLFRTVCHHGQLEVAKFLQKKYDINIYVGTG